MRILTIEMPDDAYLQNLIFTRVSECVHDVLCEINTGVSDTLYTKDGVVIRIDRTDR